MAKYSTFSPLYNNAGLGAAAKNFQGTLFGGSGGGTSELDPSQIWANEQLAQQRKAKAALDQQKHQAMADLMTNPDYHYTQIGSNYNQYQQGTSEANQRNYWEGIRDNYVASPEARSEAAYILSGRNMPGAGTKYGGYGIDTRDRRIADVFTQEREKNERDNARAIATNQADNVRAITTNQATNQSNLARGLLNVGAGNTAILPRATVEQYLGLGPDSELPSGYSRVGEGNIQFTAPAKSTTAAGKKLPPQWTNTADYKMRDRLMDLLDPSTNSDWAEVDVDGKPTKFEGLSKVPDALITDLFPAIQDLFNDPNSPFYGKSDEAAEETLRALIEPGITRIPWSGGAWFGGDDIYVPTYWMKKVNKIWDHHKDKGDIQKSIQVVRGSLKKAGYDDEATKVVINFLKKSR
jgi:hypothetical protein